MPQKPNLLLRIIVPLLVIAGGVGVAIAVFINAGKSSAPATTPAASPTTANAPAANAPAASPGDATTPAAPATAATPAAPPTPAAPAAATPTPLGTLRARTLGYIAPTTPDPAATATIGASTLQPWDTLGSLDVAATNPFRFLLTFNPAGAGLQDLQLTRHADRVGPNATNERLQRTETSLQPRWNSSAWVEPKVERQIVPFAMAAVVIDGQTIPLAAPGIFRQTAPGQFIAEVEDDQARAIARIERQFSIAPERYDIILTQKFVNLTDRALSVQWIQFGPADLPIKGIGYGGDVRRVRMGYLEPDTINPGGDFVSSSRYTIPHATVLDKPMDAFGISWAPHTLWPEPKGIAEGVKLSWVALTNRFFAVALHPLPDRQAPRADNRPDKSLALFPTIDRVVLGRGGPDATELNKQSVMILRLSSTVMTVPPSASLDASVGIYAGPITRAFIDKEPALTSVGLQGLVMYSFGGPCMVCTFQWLAGLLRGYMGLLASSIVFDWAIAVILLVVTVRTILHPITRWSQKNLTRFGKQMARLAPKQKKIQERYKDDPKKMREEVARLMQEEQINYAGALGCLPMFFQMPVWIALYAMIFFTFELRHEGAFFGVFQALTGGNWIFLADLAEPDRLIPLPESMHFGIPGLQSLMGKIDGLNILPLVLGVVFFIQHKYLSPPMTTELSPEQKLQQTMVKWMMVIMLPLFMYNAPAALSLYFMTNSILGIFESKWIRAQVDREDAEAERLREEAIKAGRPIPKAPGQAPGWLKRLQDRVAQAQEAAEKARKEKERSDRRGGR
ncbi:MAG: YidC/Oxa1 family membrane protein insertase [Phycisphaerales bacterium]|jgi:YidC/Oxa1 family membrane protein insertase